MGSTGLDGRRTSADAVRSGWGRRRYHLRSVALVGVDGSGKSTQVDLLYRALTTDGRRVARIHPFGRKLLRLRTIGPPRSSARPGRPLTRPRLLRKAAAVAELCDIGLYLWATYVFYAVASILSGEVVWLLSDRSFDDVLVKHRRLGNLSWPTVMRIRRLTPRFHETIWLDIDPVIAHERDRDFELEYYRELHDTYSIAAPKLGWKRASVRDYPADVVFGMVLAHLK